MKPYKSISVGTEYYHELIEFIKADE
jgi:hypothetical protein